MECSLVQHIELVGLVYTTFRYRVIICLYPTAEQHLKVTIEFPAMTFSSTCITKSSRQDIAKRLP